MEFEFRGERFILKIMFFLCNLVVTRVKLAVDCSIVVIQRFLFSDFMFWQGWFGVQVVGKLCS